MKEFSMPEEGVPFLMREQGSNKVYYSPDGKTFISIEEAYKLSKIKKTEELFKAMQKAAVYSHHLSDKYLEELYQLIKQ